jgi:hypothetical protein
LLDTKAISIPEKKAEKTIVMSSPMMRFVMADKLISVQPCGAKQPDARVWPAQ